MLSIPGYSDNFIDKVGLGQTSTECVRKSCFKSL